MYLVDSRDCCNQGVYTKKAPDAGHPGQFESLS